MKVSPEDLAAGQRWRSPRPVRVRTIVRCGWVPGLDRHVLEVSERLPCGRSRPMTIYPENMVLWIRQANAKLL